MPNPSDKNATGSAPKALSKAFWAGLILVVLICGLMLAAVLVSIVRAPDPAPSLENTQSFVQTVTFEGGAEFARTETVVLPPDRSRGLSGRAELADDQAMLFVFGESARHGFWMRDMLIPIDIIWIDCDGRVAGFVENLQPETYPERFLPDRPVRFVLETKAGMVQEWDIRAGQKVNFTIDESGDTPIEC